VLFHIQDNFKLISITSKLTLYYVMILPIMLYACETWTTTITNEQNLAIFERNVSRQIFGPRRNQNTKEYEWRKNGEVKSLLKDLEIIAMMNNQRIG